MIKYSITKDTKNTLTIGVRENVGRFTSDESFRSVISSMNPPTERALKVLAIPGVVEVSSYKEPSYDFYIEKGTAFTWEEILPQVEALFE